MSPSKGRGKEKRETRERERGHLSTRNTPQNFIRQNLVHSHLLFATSHSAALLMASSRFRALPFGVRARKYAGGRRESRNGEYKLRRN